MTGVLLAMVLVRGIKLSARMFEHTAHLHTLAMQTLVSIVWAAKVEHVQGEEMHEMHMRQRNSRERRRTKEGGITNAMSAHSSYSS